MTIDFGTLILAHLVGDYWNQSDDMAARKSSNSGVCLWHVIWYTASFYLFTGDAWPLWAYVAIAVTHYPVDRYALAAWWMKRYRPQFRENCDPWATILMDNIYHLLCAWFILQYIHLGDISWMTHLKTIESLLITMGMG